MPDKDWKPCMARSRTIGSDETEQGEFVPDAVESFVYHGERSNDRNGKPSIPPDLQAPLAKYQTLMNQLLDRVMRTCALSQEMWPNFFQAAFRQPCCSLQLA